MLFSVLFHEIRLVDIVSNHFMCTRMRCVCVCEQVFNVAQNWIVMVNAIICT